MKESREIEVELNYLRVRSEHDLINWAVRSFNLPPRDRPYTDFTAAHLLRELMPHIAKEQTWYTVREKHKWLASYTMRKIIYGKNGWKYWFGYPMYHDWGISVHIASA